MVENKVQTSFRVYKETLAWLDALLTNPPAWLNAAGIGPVGDRTEILERLVFLAHERKIAGQDTPSEKPVKSNRKPANMQARKRR